MAFKFLALDGTEPAVITSVSVQGGSPGLRVLGFLLADSTRQDAEDAEYMGWPPRAPSVRGSLEPAIGSTVRPLRTTNGMGYELLIGYERATDQLAVQRAVVVGYRVAGRNYQVTLPSRFIACPGKMTPRLCAGQSDRLFPTG